MTGAGSVCFDSFNEGQQVLLLSSRRQLPSPREFGQQCPYLRNGVASAYDSGQQLCRSDQCGWQWRLRRKQRLKVELLKRALATGLEAGWVGHGLPITLSFFSCLTIARAYSLPSFLKSLE